MKVLVYTAISFSLVGLIVGRYVVPVRSEHNQMQTGMSMDDRRSSFLEQRDTIIAELREDENYKCCLEKACTYCIEKTPGHGEGATCSCLEDVVNLRHPCGECIGEILEGHGNRFLAKYFAAAIAEEVGEEYKDVLKEIVSEKYDIGIDEQV